MQKERLQDEFTATLNMFQKVQRITASKEKEQVNKAKAQAFGDPYLRKYNVRNFSAIKLSFCILVTIN